MSGRHSQEQFCPGFECWNLATAQVCVGFVFSLCPMTEGSAAFVVLVSTAKVLLWRCDHGPVSASRGSAMSLEATPHPSRVGTAAAPSWMRRPLAKRLRGDSGMRRATGIRVREKRILLYPPSARCTEAPLSSELLAICDVPALRADTACAQCRYCQHSWSSLAFHQQWVRVWT